MKWVMMKEKECAEYLGFSVKKLRTMRKNYEEYLKKKRYEARRK